MSKEWKLVPVEPTKEMLEAGSREHTKNPTNANPYHKYAAMIAAAPVPPACGELETVAVIAETDGIFPETDVIHRPGIDSLPVGTELVDRDHVTRLLTKLAEVRELLDTTNYSASRDCHNAKVIGAACDLIDKEIAQ